MDGIALCKLQKFAEKPKGKELDEMKVDTSVLGKQMCGLCMRPSSNFFTCSCFSPHWAFLMVRKQQQEDFAITGFCSAAICCTEL